MDYSKAASQKGSSLWGAGIQALIDEGALYVATNPTPGTPIVTTTSVVDDAATQSATHAQAVPLMVHQNLWQTGDPSVPRTIYPVCLRLFNLTQVPTSATSWELAIRADNNPSPLTTAGGSLIVPCNLNLASGNVSRSLLQFGAVTTTIPNAQQRLIARTQVNPVIPVAKDEWIFMFGNYGVASDQISGGAGAKRVPFPMPGFSVPPGWNYRLEMWGPANAAAPSWEFEYIFAERQPGL